MDELWRAPVWTPLGVIVTFVVGIAAIIVAVRLARPSKKSLSYKVLSTTPLVTTHADAERRVQILFDGNIVHDVKLMLIKLINSGNIPIASNDYENPIKICLDSSNDDAQILDSGVANASPASLFEEAAVKFEKQVVHLEPLLLNEKDSVTIKILVTGFNGKVRVDGRIVGVKEIKEVKRGWRDHIASISWGFVMLLMLVWVILYVLGVPINVRAPFVLAALLAMFVAGYFSIKESSGRDL